LLGHSQHVDELRVVQQVALRVRQPALAVHSALVISCAGS
jgi:hypothetical protein